jgi:hypothetical protein
MPIFPIDPFKAARKNAHIWHGENATIWYNEKLDGSFSVLVLYEFSEKKRRLFLEINDQDRLIEFKNDELMSEQFAGQLQEIRTIEKMLTEAEQLSGSLPF